MPEEIYSLSELAVNLINVGFLCRVDGLKLLAANLNGKSILRNLK